MSAAIYPIPARLNLAIAAVQVLLLVAIIWGAGQAAAWWSVALLALAYGIVMNSGYAILHEAEHNLLHPHPIVNQIGGAVLALFFPAPFHLLRQGHLGHHLRNRSDDEAFDFYFEGDNPVWKWLQLYGILTGLFWLTIVLGNVLALLNPAWLTSRHLSFDRPTDALRQTLNPKYNYLIRIEAAALIALHGSLMAAFGVPPLRYAAVLFGFGAIWSALQYVHHFGTVRDVRRGARNLRTFAPLDVIWLNHNWHRNHHEHPTIPWIHLPRIDAGERGRRGSLVLAYLKMWRGPRFTTDRVENRFAGKLIR